MQVKKMILFLLVQIPLILWQHMFIMMYFHKSKNIDYSNDITSSTLVLMIVLTLFLAYKYKKFNELRLLTLWFIPLALMVAIIFNNSYLAQIVLFLLYLIILVLPRKEKSKVDFVEESETSSQISTLNTFEDLLKRGNLPDDDRIVPLWLQIKNEIYKTIPTTKEIIDNILTLDNDEFMNYINRTINQNIFFAAMSCAKDEELKSLYVFLEKGKEGLSLQFKDKIEEFAKKDIKKEQLEYSLMLVSLYSKEAKNTFSKFIRLHRDMNQSNFSKEDESLFELEYSINSLFFHSNRDLYQKLKELISLIKELNESGKITDEFCTHIASKFAPVLNPIDRMYESEYTKLEYDLKWFIDKFISDELKILKDESILHQLILLHCLRLQAIEDKKDDEYLEHTIALTRYYLAYSPNLKENALYYLAEIMDFVAQKEITVANANAFIEVFEVIPALYEEISYENIILFKELINKKLANSKPQDNEIFTKEGVKNKIILLNYFLDMEDLYYESGQVKEFVVYLNGSEDCMGKSIYLDGIEHDSLDDEISSFTTKEEANKFIESKVDYILRDMAKYSNSIEELKTMDPSQSMSYYIKDKDGEKTFFKTWDYIQKRAEYIFKSTNKKNIL